METENFKKAKIKIASYCAYQERCQQEVRSKLFSYGLYQSEVDELLAWLITENFVNEQRFAQTFAGSKFRVKNWGRFKITQALKQKDISDYCVRKGLDEIDDDDYLATIRMLLKKKLDQLGLKSLNGYQLKDKASKFVISKGFEPNLVWQVLNNLSSYSS